MGKLFVSFSRLTLETKYIKRRLYGVSGDVMWFQNLNVANSESCCVIEFGFRKLKLQISKSFSSIQVREGVWWHRERMNEWMNGWMRFMFLIWAFIDNLFNLFDLIYCSLSFTSLSYSPILQTQWYFTAWELHLQHPISESFKLNIEFSISVHQHK